MIVAHIQDEGTEFDIFPEAFKKSLEWLKKADFSALENKKYAIDDQINVIISAYETKLQEECKSEVHRDQLDIQYIISGAEVIQVGSHHPTNVFATEYDEAKDRWFFSKVSTEKDVIMTAGMYAVFFPTDIHRPGCVYQNQSTTVRKAVVKIPIKTLK